MKRLSLFAVLSLVVNAPALAQDAYPGRIPTIDDMNSAINTAVTSQSVGTAITTLLSGKANITDVTSPVINSFSLTGQLYSATDSTHYYGRTMLFQTPLGSRPRGLGGLNIALNDTGSGVGSGLSTAGIPLTIDAAKQGYLGSVPPTAGEIDGLNIGMRNDNGDGTGILINSGGVLRPYLATRVVQGWGSLTTLTDPTTSSVVQSVSTQGGVMDTHANLGGTVGVIVNKNVGAGGNAFVTNALSGASWTNDILLSGNNQTHFAVRSSDAALLHYSNTGVNEYAQINDGATEHVYLNSNEIAQWSTNGLLLKKDLTIQAVVPTSSTASCVTGTIRANATYVYVCTATNIWKRAALQTFSTTSLTSVVLAMTTAQRQSYFDALAQLDPTSTIAVMSKGSTVAMTDSLGQFIGATLFGSPSNTSLTTLFTAAGASQ